MRVVCLHGLGRTPADWDAVRPALEPFGAVTAPALAGGRGDALAAAAGATGDGDILVGHSMGALLALRLAAEPGRSVGAVVLTGCFFPPARNGRGTAASLTDYAAHRVAFLRETGVGGATPGSRRGTAGSLASLVGLAVRPAAFAALTRAVTAPVLVVHARDDHHVPVDFALAGRRPGWALHVLEHGGHHVHVDHPRAWLVPVTRWLAARTGSPTAMSSLPLCPTCGQPASQSLADTDPGWECRNEACPEFGQPIRDDEAETTAP